MRNLLIAWTVVFFLLVVSLAHAEEPKTPFSEQEIHNMAPEVREFFEEICKTYYGLQYAKMRASQERQIVGQDGAQTVYSYSADYVSFVHDIMIGKKKLAAMEKQLGGPLHANRCPAKWR